MLHFLTLLKVVVTGPCFTITPLNHIDQTITCLIRHFHPVICFVSSPCSSPWASRRLACRPAFSRQILSIEVSWANLHRRKSHTKIRLYSLKTLSWNIENGGVWIKLRASKHLEVSSSKGTSHHLTNLHPKITTNKYEIVSALLHYI